MGKTIRFGDLVRESGRPEVVTLWTDPKKDRPFSKAIRENRVMTVWTDPSSHRKDAGKIGFHPKDGAIYLVFPRPLPTGVDSRIVGINYQLTEDKPPKDPVTEEFWDALAHKEKLRKEKARKEIQKKELKKLVVKKEEVVVEKRIPEKVVAPPKPEPKPKLKTFEVTVRRIATLTEKLQVKADTEEAAREAALKAVKAKRFAIGRADVQNEIEDVQSVRA